MENKNINRLKVVLAEKNITNKWLAQEMKTSPATISKWVTNSSQPSLEQLLRLADILEIRAHPTNPVVRTHGC